jgi:hypothetical protein
MISTVLAVAAGYVLCIIVPCPGLSRWVLEKWAALGRWIVKD